MTKETISMSPKELDLPPDNSDSVSRQITRGAGCGPYEHINPGR